MKKTLFVFALTFSVMLSSSSYAGWTQVAETEDGNVLYVDFERIRKHGGHVYFWSLTDFLKPIATGKLSGKIYVQGDCKLFRFKNLSFVHHKQPMGKDIGESNSPENPEWRYASPNSSIEAILQSVCNR